MRHLPESPVQALRSSCSSRAIRTLTPGWIRCVWRPSDTHSFVRSFVDRDVGIKLHSKFHYRRVHLPPSAIGIQHPPPSSSAACVYRSLPIISRQSWNSQSHSRVYLRPCPIGIGREIGPGTRMRTSTLTGLMWLDGAAGCMSVRLRPPSTVRRSARYCLLCFAFRVLRPRGDGGDSDSDRHHLGTYLYCDIFIRLVLVPPPRARQCWLLVFISPRARALEHWMELITQSLVPCLPIPSPHLHSIPPEARLRVRCMCIIALLHCEHWLAVSLLLYCYCSIAPRHADLEAYVHLHLHLHSTLALASRIRIRTRGCVWRELD